MCSPACWAFDDLFVPKVRLGGMGGVAVICLPRSHQCGLNGSWVRSSARVLDVS
jgi:hypothetical protein